MRRRPLDAHIKGVYFCVLSVSVRTYHLFFLPYYIHFSLWLTLCLGSRL